nr:MAG TPA: hypothetical protein [Caudoviricetes sp.]
MMLYFWNSNLIKYNCQTQLKTKSNQLFYKFFLMIQ